MILIDYSHKQIELLFTLEKIKQNIPSWIIDFSLERFLQIGIYQIRKSRILEMGDVRVTSSGIRPNATRKGPRENNFISLKPSTHFPVNSAGNISDTDITSPMIIKYVYNYLNIMIFMGTTFKTYVHSKQVGFETKLHSRFSVASISKSVTYINQKVR